MTFRKENAEIPLITKPDPENPDVLHIIREVFRDTLSKRVLPKNIVENATKYKTENEELIHSITYRQNEPSYTISDIGNAEEKVMLNYAEVLNNENEIDDYRKKEKLLKKDKIFPPLDVNFVQKYNLLQAEDLLPSLPEQNIDFQINTQKHDCKKCYNKTELDLVPVRLTNTCPHAEHIKENTLISSRKRKLQKHTAPVQRDAETVLKAIPEQITFCNYKINTVYKQIFKVRNISKASRNFTVRPLSLNSPFKIELKSDSTRLAPGISAQFKVTFLTEAYKDVEDEVLINASNGSILKIRLICCRNAPILRGFVLLTSDKKYFSNFQAEDLETTDRHIVVNSTLDCGYCFIGQTNILNVLLKNEGGPGAFFLMSENDWYMKNVTNVSTNMVLEIENFQIHPAYFYMDEGEILDLEVVFFPTDSGLQLAKLFFLCDNCTYQEIDIIGDGLYYKPYYVEIDAPLKTNPGLTNDSKAKMILNLGAVSPNHFVSEDIVVTNTSCMDLLYRWEVRNCDKDNCFRNKDLHKIKKDDVVISPLGSYLPAYSTTEFNVHIKTDKDIGFFGCVFGLVIANIPQAALAENETFTVYEKNGTETCSHFLDIFVNEIEISYECIPVKVSLCPKNINVPFISYGSGPICREVKLETDESITLDCEWIKPDEEICKCIIIKPRAFTLSPNSKMICDVIISFAEFYDVHETCCLSINKGQSYEVLYIDINTEKPKVTLSPEHINFGFVRLNADYRKMIQIKNVYDTKVKWKIDFFLYNNDAGCLEYKKNDCLSMDEGTFNYKDEVCNVEFKLNTQQAKKYLAFLLLTTKHTSRTTTTGVCMIAAEISEPNLEILVPNSEHGILCIEEILYFGIQSTRTIQIHNLSGFSNGFVWGQEFSGADADKLEISFKPRCGCLDPDETKEVQVTVMPRCVGIFDEVYVPCFVSHHRSPLVLRVMCAVDDFKVKFFLPNRWGKYDTEVLWPDEYEEEISFVSDIEKYLKENVDEEGQRENVPESSELDGGMVNADLKNDDIKKNTISDAQLEYQDMNIIEEVTYDTMPIGDVELLELTEAQTELEEERDEEIELTQEEKLLLFHQKHVKQIATKIHKLKAANLETIDNRHYMFTLKDTDSVLDWSINLSPRGSELQNALNELAEAEKSTESLMETSSSEKFLAKESIKAESETECFQVPLRNILENKLDLNFNKHKVEAVNVKARQVTKIKIGVKNVTPMQGEISLMSKNFYPVSKKALLDSIVYEMRSLEYDWEDTIHSDYGLVVTIDPQNLKMQAFEHKEIVICIYGNTWGTYAEEIMCLIRNCPIFVFDLFINIDGYPIEFPFARNTTTERPIMRLGRYPFASMCVKRHLKVSNRSCVPLKVVWHVYMDQTSDLDEKKVPFNFLIDIFEHGECNNAEEIKTMLTNYYGQEDCSLLKIMPREMFIEPLSSSPIALVLNPYDILRRTAKPEINAALIGYVYTDKNSRSQKLCVRNESPEDVPTVVKVQGGIEYNNADLELLAGDLRIDLPVTSFTDSDCTVLQKPTIRLVFKNISNAFDLITLKVEVPLKIVGIITEHGDLCDTTHGVIVPQGSYIEVYLKCEILQRTVIKMAEWLYTKDESEKCNNSINYQKAEQNLIKMNPFLCIIHNGVRKQHVMFNVNIHFPELIVHKLSLDFAVVFVGDKSERYFTLNNESCYASPFEVIASNDEVLTVTPKTGTVPGKSNVEIQIVFAPVKSGDYCESLSIVAGVPYFKITIEISGVGSYNEKYCD